MHKPGASDARASPMRKLGAISGHAAAPALPMGYFHILMLAPGLRLGLVSWSHLGRPECLEGRSPRNFREDLPRLQAHGPSVHTASTKTPRTIKSRDWRNRTLPVHLQPGSF
jgi:hypothetical protein